MTDEGRIQVPDALPGEPRLRAMIARLLRPSPAERFASARDVRQALLTAPSVAIVGRRSRFAVSREIVESLQEPVPRPIKGKTKKLLNDASPGMLELMEPTAKPGDVPGIFDGLTLAFFSVVTAGVLPLVYFSLARARRRRLKRFIREGTPTVAEILSIEKEKLPFESSISARNLRVRCRWRAAPRFRYRAAHDCRALATRRPHPDPVRARAGLRQRHHQCELRSPSRSRWEPRTSTIANSVFGNGFQEFGFRESVFSARERERRRERAGFRFRKPANW